MRTGIGKVVNTESAFFAGLGALVWGFSFAGADKAARVTLFLIYVQGLIALCGGFWWKRYKQQEVGTNGNGMKVSLSTEGKVDPLMDNP